MGELPRAITRHDVAGEPPELEIHAHAIVAEDGTTTIFAEDNPDAYIIADNALEVPRE